MSVGGGLARLSCGCVGRRPCNPPCPDPRLLHTCGAVDVQRTRPPWQCVQHTWPQEPGWLGASGTEAAGIAIDARGNVSRAARAGARTRAAMSHTYCGCCAPFHAFACAVSYLHAHACTMIGNEIPKINELERAMRAEWEGARFVMTEFEASRRLGTRRGRDETR